MRKLIYTIGHSTHTVERFIELLKLHDILAVCDVRSSPYSSYNPQFNREVIQSELKKKGLAYVYLGKELGPRSDDPGCYENGRVQYGLLAKTELFHEGIRRVKEGMNAYRIALMCSEKDPVMCHRTLLVCRRLAADGVGVRHILDDAGIEEHEDAMTRLRRLLKLPEADLFTSSEQMMDRVYDVQGKKIAYVIEEKAGTEVGRGSS